MFNKIIYTFLLQNLNCFYAEVERVLNTNNQDNGSKSIIKPKTFYWFGTKEETCLVYFDNRLDFHKNPFLLLIIIPETSDKDELKENFCQELAVAFDNFYEKSAFLSFLPNEQQRKIYKFLTKLGKFKIDGEVELRKTEAVMAVGFELNKLTICTSLLESVEFGTVAKSRLYRVEDTLYGLFVETYYTIYQSVDKDAKVLNSFRTADLVEIGYVVSKITSVQNKLFLTGNKHELEVHFLQKIKPKEKNKYTLQDYFRSSTKSVILFDLEENENRHFQFFIDEKKLYSDVETPSFSKLSRVSTTFYVFENSGKEEVGIELPVYFFGEKLELSKLVFMLKLIQTSSFSGFRKVDTFFIAFGFDAESNSYWIDSLGITYIVSFDYTIENGNVVLGINSMRTLRDTSYVLKKQEITDINDLIGKNGFFVILDGAIVYNQNSIITLTDLAYSTTTLTKSEVYTKEFKEMQKNTAIYSLLAVVLLAFCLFLGQLFYRYRTKKHKRKYFNRN